MDDANFSGPAPKHFQELLPLNGDIDVGRTPSLNWISGEGKGGRNRLTITIRRDDPLPCAREGKNSHGLRNVLHAATTPLWQSLLVISVKATETALINAAHNRTETKTEKIRDRMELMGWWGAWQLANQVIVTNLFDWHRPPGADQANGFEIDRCSHGISFGGPSVGISRGVIAQGISPALGGVHQQDEHGGWGGEVVGPRTAGGGSARFYAYGRLA